MNHPHICTLYDIGVQDGVDYLVMEYIDGQTLQKRLAGGPLPLTRALEYAIQIVDALDKAHRCGVIHRDLKPANIMLTGSGVKLLDFGLATRLTATGTGSENQSAENPESLSGERTVMGTPEYSSPEQLQGKPVDARTDIFSFGATAFEMITGQRAFPGREYGSRGQAPFSMRIPVHFVNSLWTFPLPLSGPSPGASQKTPTSVGRPQTTCCSNYAQSHLVLQRTR